MAKSEALAGDRLLGFLLDRRIAGAILIACVLLIYGRTIGYPYVDWDDKEYVIRNMVLAEAADGHWGRLFTEQVMGNYHPVTMLSYAVERFIVSDSPHVRHGTNVLLHALNALLVLVFVARLTGRRLLAFAVALLWALHPLHVENVAWISARKDLLMVLFGISGLIAWMRWRENGGWFWYTSAVVLFTLACLSKAMAVAFVPCMFLIDLKQGSAWRSKQLLRLAPFVLFAIATGLLALNAQENVGTLNNRPLDTGARIITGLANLSVYSGQQLVPARLSVFYDYPSFVAGIPVHYTLLAILAIALSSAFLLWKPLRASWAAFGFWFMVVHLILVLQWIPVGEAVRADRYMYAAGIGATLATVAFGRTMVGLLGIQRWRLALLGLTAAIYGVLTWVRLPVWSDPVSIWSEMLADEPQRYWHHMDRAIAHEDGGRYAEAEADYDAAVRKGRTASKPRFERGMYRIRRGLYREAMPDLLQVYQNKPNYPGLMENMLYAEMKMGMYADLIGNATALLRIKPDAADVLNMRAYAYLRTGDIRSAGYDIERSINLRNDYAEVWFLKGLHLLGSGDTANACGAFERSKGLLSNERDLAFERDSLSFALGCYRKTP